MSHSKIIHDQEEIKSENKESSINYKELSIFIGTFNINRKNPKSGDLIWLNSDQNPPDIYAIGLQESNSGSSFDDSTGNEEWLKAVTASLHVKAEYVKIESIHLVGTMLIVFVKKDLQNFVTNVSVCTVATGTNSRMVFIKLILVFL